MPNEFVSNTVRSSLLLGIVLVASLPALAQCNTVPTAQPDTGITVDNEVLWIDVLGNDSDPDGQPLSVAVTSESCLGSVSVVGEFVRLTPVPISGGDQEQCTISYEITDGEANASSTVAVTVNRFIVEIFSDGFESGDTSAWALEGNEP